MARRGYPPEFRLLEERLLHNRQICEVDDAVAGEADRRPLVQQRVAVTAWLHNGCIRTVGSEIAHPPARQNLHVQQAIPMAGREGLEPPTLRFEARSVAA